MLADQLQPQMEQEKLILFSTDENICQSTIREAPEKYRQASCMQPDINGAMPFPLEHGITPMLDQSSLKRSIVNNIGKESVNMSASYMSSVIT